jgi:multiple sugar transport system ATP-binding protein
VAEIRFENVSKRYGGHAVVEDFSIAVADGEFVVLVGPSGSGKSTVLKILAGLEAASAGRVLIGGRDVTDTAPGDRDIAMVFQNYALYPHLSVRRNMGFGLKMRGTPAAEIDRRVAAAAATLGVEELLDRKPRQLSGGQRQRVALGRAIVREPQAFLMDEPLSNLDAKLRVQMRAEISALHKRLAVTTVYVTHDQIEAMTMADRIVLMRDGRIQQIGAPDALFGAPANLFVAGFIGSPGMNIVPAELAPGGPPVLKLLGIDVRMKRESVQAPRKLLAGIRPEHLYLGEGGATFTAIPILVESLGSEKYVHFTLPGSAGANMLHGDTPMVARLMEAGAVPLSAPIQLSFDPARLHLFDASTHQAVR